MLKKSVGILVASSIVLSTACGGGGSSSGGAKNGTYKGRVDYTIRFSNGQIFESAAAANFTVSGKNITVSDTVRTGNGKVSGSKFTAPLKFSTTGDSGVSCDWNLLYTGEITSALISGVTSGTLICSDNINGSVSGSFQSVKEAVAARQKIGAFQAP